MIETGLIVDIMFSMKNLKMLQTIVHDQILLKIWFIRLRSMIIMFVLSLDIMETFEQEKLDIIKNIFDTINRFKLMWYVCLRNK